MSPSESDLRAALREGEGEGRVPSADSIIAGALWQRRQRRLRWTQAAAAAVVVGAIGVGAVALGGGDGGRNAGGGMSAAQDSGSTRDGAPDSAYGAGGGAPRPTAGGAAGGTSVPTRTDARASGAVASPAACPSAPPRLVVPGGGGTGQFGGDGPLFPQPVASLTVCGYRSAAATAPSAATRFDAAGAKALVAALERAAVTPAVRPCPSRTGGPEAPSLVFVATGSDGTALEPVVATLGGCHVMVTNGTAVRYDPDLPAAVTRLAGS